MSRYLVLRQNKSFRFFILLLFLNTCIEAMDKVRVRTPSGLDEFPEEKESPVLQRKKYAFNNLSKLVRHHHDDDDNQIDYDRDSQFDKDVKDYKELHSPSKLKRATSAPSYDQEDERINVLTLIKTLFTKVSSSQSCFSSATPLHVRIKSASSIEEIQYLRKIFSNKNPQFAQLISFVYFSLRGEAEKDESSILQFFDELRKMLLPPKTP